MNYVKRLDIFQFRTTHNPVSYKKSYTPNKLALNKDKSCNKYSSFLHTKCGIQVAFGINFNFPSFC